MPEYFNNYGFSGLSTMNTNDSMGFNVDDLINTTGIPDGDQSNSGGLFKGFTDGIDSLGGIAALGKFIGSIGGLLSGFKQNKLLKNTLNFQKDAFNKNFNNQVKTYNTNLADRINARYSFEGKTQDQANQYINNNKL